MTAPFGSQPNTRRNCPKPRTSDHIHRGTKQIGGTCVEIEASGSRIIVDLGLPLDAVELDSALVPQLDSGSTIHRYSLLFFPMDIGATGACFRKFVATSRS